jgi:HEAT repeat protein
MERPNTKLEQALKKWRDGASSLEETVALSRELGNQHVEEGIPVLIDFLRHDDEVVRYNAVIALGFDLHYKPATAQLLNILAQDEDADVRDAAAGAIRVLWQNTANREVLGALAKSALGDADEGVRKAAYRSLLIVKGISEDEHLRLLSTSRQPVDRVVVEGILKGGTGQE